MYPKSFLHLPWLLASLSHFSDTLSKQMEALIVERAQLERDIPTKRFRLSQLQDQGQRVALLEEINADLARLNYLLLQGVPARSRRRSAVPWRFNTN